MQMVTPTMLARILGRLLLAGALACSFTAPAQDFPSKPVKIVVPAPSGGTTDALARMMAEKLAAKWGQSVLVDNRGGAGGSIGSEHVYRSAPDGYTILFSPGPSVHKLLNPRLAYDPDAFVPISMAAIGYSVLLVHPKVGVNTVQELIAIAKANPGKLTYASQGVAFPAHLTGELFKFMAGIDIVHVAYKGNAPAFTDLLGGQVDMMFVNLGAALPHIRAQKLRPVAIGSDKRNPLLPDVPAMSEVLPGFLSMIWFGMLAPPGTPPAVASHLSAAAAAAVKQPDVARWLAEQGLEAVGSTSSQMAQLLQQDNERWGQVIRAAGIKID